MILIQRSSTQSSAVDRNVIHRVLYVLSDTASASASASASHVPDDAPYCYCYCYYCCCVCDSQCLQDGGTPLMMAAGGGHLKAVAILLAAGADIGVVDKVGTLSVRNIMQYDMTWHDMTWNMICNDMLYDMIWHDMHNDISCHVTLSDVLLCQIVMAYSNSFYCIYFYFILFHFILSYLILSYVGCGCNRAAWLL